MTSLQDAFSDKDKEEFAKRHLGIGTVIRLHDAIAGKIKRFIIVGESFDKISLAAIFINTEINANVFRDRHSQELQILLSKEENDHLDHDSYADCTDFYEKNKESLIDLIKKDVNIIMGKLCDRSLNEVQAGISSSRKISGSRKKTYGLFFTPRLGATEIKNEEGNN